MARGTILREWKCDVCGRVVRDDLGGAGDAALPPTDALDSWKLPDKWRRISIQESHGTTRDVIPVIVVDACDKCFETGATGRLGKLDETAKTVSGFYEPQDKPAEPIDFNTVSSYEKLHGTDTVRVRATKVENK